MKILVVGAGVAGLSIGWRLAQTGYSVDILEAGLTGRAASWAAAGMIGAAGELSDGKSELAVMGREAMALWPGFAQEIETASGRTISYRADGALVVALDGDSALRLQQRHAALIRSGDGAEWLSTAEARKREPVLAPDIAGALYVAADAQVDNRALTDALAEAFRRAGGRILENTRVESLLAQNGRVQGVATNAGVRAADAVVVCAGAWSGLLGEVMPPIRPAKGQMAALVPPPGATIPTRPIWGNAAYLVPRQGRVLLGATVEEAGFDTGVTKAVLENLLERARRLAPDIENWPVVESWAGLRPRTPDDAPVLGPTGVDGLFVACGQFRNGILFAPVIADALKRFVSGTEVGFPAQAFRLDRFAVP